MKFLYHLFLFVFCVDVKSVEAVQKLEIGKAPYVVVIRLNGDIICNGAIVKNYWVLTSSYCFGKDGNYSVQYGTTEFNNINNTSVMTKKILKKDNSQDHQHKKHMVLLKLFNIKFVGEVEKHPELYDYNLREYSRKDYTEKAWNGIAEKFNMSGGCYNINHGLSSLATFSLNHNLKLKIAMCEVIVFTSPIFTSVINDSLKINVDGTLLGIIRSGRNLGLIFACKLRFTEYVDTEFILGVNVQNALLPDSQAPLPSNAGTVIYNTDGTLYSFEIMLRGVVSTLIEIGSMKEYGGSLQGSPFIIHGVMFGMLFISEKINSNSSELFTYMVNLPYLIEWIEQRATIKKK